MGKESIESQVLSQAEVERLLNAVYDSRTDDDAEGPVGLQSGVIEYDLANQDRIIRGRMPTLDLIHDYFIRLFRESLSNLLGRNIQVSVNSTGPLKFSEFMNSLPYPSACSIFNFGNLKGSGVVIFERTFVSSSVGALFGGTKEKNETKRKSKRTFSVIESKTIETTIKLMLADYQSAWKNVHPLTCEFSRTEFNPMFVNVIAPRDYVIATTFDVEFVDEVKEEQSSHTYATIKIVLPYSSLEPIRNKLANGLLSERSTTREVLPEEVSKIETSLIVLREQHFLIGDLEKKQAGDTLVFKDRFDEGLFATISGEKSFKLKPFNGDYGKFVVESKVSGAVGYDESGVNSFQNRFFFGLKVEDAMIFASMCRKCNSYIAHESLGGVKEELACTVCGNRKKSNKTKNRKEVRMSKKASKGRFSKVPVVVSVVLGRTKMRYEDLHDLVDGSVIQLSKIAGEPLEVYVGDQLFAMGEVVVVNECFGVRLTDMVMREEEENGK